MNTHADKIAGLRRKLREGQQLLAEADSDDDSLLGLALIKLHGALEDFFRIEIARRAPHLRSEVEEAGQSNWRDLIRYGKQYMALGEQDIQIINRANFLRQEVAHGGNYQGSREELVRYARLVQRWCGPADSARSTEARRPASPAPAPVFFYPGRAVARQARWSCLPALGMLLVLYCACWWCVLSSIQDVVNLFGSLMERFLQMIIGGWVFPWVL